MWTQNSMYVTWSALAEPNEWMKCNVHTCSTCACKWQVDCKNQYAQSMHHCYKIDSSNSVGYVSKNEEKEKNLHAFMCARTAVVGFICWREFFFAVLLHKHIRVQRYEWIN